MAHRLCGDIIIFGTGKRARNLIKNHIQCNPAVSRLMAADITPPSSGMFYIDDKAIPVMSPEGLKSINTPCTILITDNEHMKESITCLKDLNLGDNISYCIAIFEYMTASVCGKQGPSDPVIIDGHSIPNVIHSFWFSNDAIPDLYMKCMDSWHKIMPDTEIKIWNSDSYDVSSHSFTSSAYEAKRWAYVSDYARLDVIHRYGGIYLDMDVMLIKPLTDMLSCRGFFGYDVHGNIDLGNGFGSEAGNPLLMSLMKKYDETTFTDRAICMQPDLLRQTFIDNGIECLGNYGEYDGNVFYPRNIFSPYDSISHIRFADMSRTYSAHLYNSGWLDSDQVIRRDDRYIEYASVIDLISEEEYQRASYEACILRHSGLHTNQL